MEQLISLGQCLFSLAAATVVALGIWRAWTKKPAEDGARPAPEVLTPRPAGWSIRGELARLFLANDVKAYVSFDMADPPVMSPVQGRIEQTDQTDQQTDLDSAADLWLDRIEVDRTRTTVIELLVYSGWKVGEIRDTIKGDSGAIGTEVEAAKRRLGITEEPRQLRVRDQQGERMIPMEAKP